MNFNDITNKQRYKIIYEHLKLSFPDLNDLYIGYILPSDNEEIVKELSKTYTNLIDESLKEFNEIFNLLKLLARIGLSFHGGKKDG